MTIPQPSIDPDHKHHLYRGFAAAALVVLIWSGFNIVSRLGGRSELTPFDMLAIRLGVSGLVCLPVVFMRRNRIRWRQIVPLSALGGMGYGMLVYSGFSLAPAAHAGILVNGGIPFANALLAWLVLGYRPGVRSELALLVAGAGIALIGLHSFSQIATGSPHQWLGDVFFLLAAVCYASFGLLMKHWHVPPLEAVIGLAVVGMLVYLPVYFLFLPKAISVVPLDFVLLQGAYQGILAGTFASLLFAYAVHYIGPQSATLMLAMVPGISAVAAVPLLGEPLDLVTIAGVVLVTVGALLGARNHLRKPV